MQVEMVIEVLQELQLMLRSSPEGFKMDKRSAIRVAWVTILVTGSRVHFQNFPRKRHCKQLRDSFYILAQNE